MVAVVHRPISRPVPLATEATLSLTPEMLPASGSAARILARCYLRYVSALWRGDESAAAFAGWLDTFWQAEMPSASEAVPAAISPHGGAGHGICWFETRDEILGYVGGATGGYRLPLGAVRHAEELSPRDTGGRKY
jgi:hypothetical protein